MLEQAVEVLGPDPYTPLANELVQLRAASGDVSGARELAQVISANVIGVPAEPSPLTMVPDVALPVKLDWSDCQAAERYQVFIWREGQQQPRVPIANVQRNSELSLVDLVGPCETVFWRVKAVGRYGEILGPVWVFRTAESSR